MREDQHRISVTINGVSYGVWDKMSGGSVDSEETKYRPGGLSAEVSLGGSKSVENVTVSRLYQLDRDHGQIKALIALVGKGTVTVSKQPLDVDGNAFGDPVVYTGKLKQITLPDVDSESSDAAMVELEVSSAGTVS